MKRWFVGMMLMGVLVGGATMLVANAQPAPTASPSPTPMSTMQP